METTHTKATPTPWFVESDEIWGKQTPGLDSLICVMRGQGRSDGDNHANAALIVRACNSFEALREAVEHALHDAESRLYMLPVKAEQTERDIIEAQMGIYRQALALARGEAGQP